MVCASLVNGREPLLLSRELGLLNDRQFMCAPLQTIDFVQSRTVLCQPVS